MESESDTEYTSEVVSDNEKGCTVITMDKGYFNSKIREYCMQVAVFDLVGCKADRLPSKSTLANIMVEARSISHLQIADTVPNYSTNMLHSDGTTKFGEKYGGLQITTPVSCYTLSLTTMKAGGASDFKELLVNALSDVNSTCQTVKQTAADISKKILASIKNTMSDRHIVKKKFNELLESYRAEILPDVVIGWNTFTPDQKLSFTHVNNFFCGLHFIVGLADTAAKTLKKWESLHLDEESTNSEAGTLRLIWSPCKAIQNQCSQQAGCHIMFKAYLETQGISIFPIAKFQGNRFNIVFYNAAGIYYYKESPYSIFERNTPNSKLVTPRDLKNSHFIVGCHALGIVSKCITGPLWRLLESTETMSELGAVYQKMHRLFLKWSENAADLLVLLRTKKLIIVMLCVLNYLKGMKRMIVLLLNSYRCCVSYFGQNVK